ncbi:ABC transporter permease [Sphingomonas sp. PAMC 26617]|uniref:ABC transporter permease n=1 Tax=Sphingomonas sp. PAMC 26617 TaxID=1112216 RepID=UPI001E42DC2E|nr:ABC transporter permease [Sphingomonas sp. PAMC 26617]
MWMLVEPAMLAASVALIHVGSGGTGGGHYTSDLRLIPFTLIGYCTFMIFRSIVTRAETTLDANKALLFHRAVTILDMLLARAILELLATMAALALLLSLAIAFGIADWPARPLRLLAGIVLLTWFSLALSMGIATGSYFSKAFNKLVHPVTYIAMPLSGAFFVLQWIPQPYRGYLSWSPLGQRPVAIEAAAHLDLVDPLLVDPPER